MGYTQRLLIGVIIIFSAYSLFNDADYRHQFHILADLVQQQIGFRVGCYCWLQKARQIAVALIFTAGVSLVLDFGVVVAIVGQLLWLAFEAVPLRDGASLSQIQWVVINTVILLFLIRAKWETNELPKIQNRESIPPATGTISQPISAPREKDQIAVESKTNLQRKNTSSSSNSVKKSRGRN